MKFLSSGLGQKSSLDDVRSSYAREALACSASLSRLRDKIERTFNNLVGWIGLS